MIETSAKGKDADTIRGRHRIGTKAVETMALHSWGAIAADYGMHETSLRRLMRGDFQSSTRLTEGDKVRIWERRELFWKAHAERNKHGVAALKRDYHMSTDTLNKIIDSAPERSAVAAFLTGRFDTQVSRDW